MQLLVGSYEFLRPMPWSVRGERYVHLRVQQGRAQASDPSTKNEHDREY